MKSLFPHPIGTIKDLGTTREWVTEAACIALCALILIALYIIF